MWDDNSTTYLNSQAVGMALAQLLGFKIDFLRNLFSRSAEWFFVIILKFIFTPSFGSKVHVKKFLGIEKNSFSKPGFHKTIYGTLK